MRTFERKHEGSEGEYLKKGRKVRSKPHDSPLGAEFEVKRRASAKVLRLQFARTVLKITQRTEWQSRRNKGRW